MSLDRVTLNIDTAQAATLQIALVAASYNERRVNRLLSLVKDRLLRLAVTADHVETYRVPGSMEIPFAASRLVKNNTWDAIIALGVVIAGDTNHHEVIGNCTANALQKISIVSGVPVINGILVVNNEQQADARLGNEIDRGSEFANAAVSMALFARSLSHV